MAIVNDHAGDATLAPLLATAGATGCIDGIATIIGIYVRTGNMDDDTRATLTEQVADLRSQVARLRNARERMIRET